jgi:hypothetical protein
MTTQYSQPMTVQESAETAYDSVEKSMEAFDRVGFHIATQDSS